MERGNYLKKKITVVLILTLLMVTIISPVSGFKNFAKTGIGYHYPVDEQRIATEFNDIDSWQMFPHNNKQECPIEVIFPNKHLALSLSECGGRDEMYYIYTNNSMCGYSLFGKEKPLLENLTSNLKIMEIKKDGCVALYKIEK